MSVQREDVAMRAVLELHLTCAAGREVECAKHLAGEVRAEHWAILAALAAEILAEHERRADGSRVVLVAGAAQAERVLADLTRK